MSAVTETTPALSGGGCFCAVKPPFLSHDMLLRQCDVVGVHDVLVTIMNIITITVLILIIITVS